MIDLTAELNGLLNVYKANIDDSIGDLVEEAAQELVSETKRTAPYAHHGENAKRRRHFRNSITYIRQDTGRSTPRCIWHVKGADYRLTHLLTHGHQARDGSRVQGNPFLQNACDKIFPELEKKIEEAIKQ
jgi:hypothetical protein